MGLLDLAIKRVKKGIHDKTMTGIRTGIIESIELYAYTNGEKDFDRLDLAISEDIDLGEAFRGNLAKFQSDTQIDLIKIFDVARKLKAAWAYYDMVDFDLVCSWLDEDRPDIMEHIRETTTYYKDKDGKDAVYKQGEIWLDGNITKIKNVIFGVEENE